MEGYYASIARFALLNKRGVKLKDSETSQQKKSKQRFNLTAKLRFVRKQRAKDSLEVRQRQELFRHLKSRMLGGQAKLIAPVSDCLQMNLRAGKGFLNQQRQEPFDWK
ncbi:MAG: hypothetical protein ACKVZH_26570 [Blastocatellia bacterium]